MLKNFFEGKKALVVINPTSGKRTTKTQLFDIADLFSTSGLETTVFTTRGPGDATDIVRRRGMDFDIVVCRGGDGTFNETVNGVMSLERRPLLGYIPSGSTNDLAQTLCIPVNSTKKPLISFSTASRSGTTWGGSTAARIFATQLLTARLPTHLTKPRKNSRTGWATRPICCRPRR
ncbi:MAG: hypothetical protein LBG83_02735 [Oscillospiraceae bacterium]|jgi:hypothetical protein|nr:hypothetical protein [Oscillospiraceae bacterium]